MNERSGLSEVPNSDVVSCGVVLIVRAEVVKAESGLRHGGCVIGAEKE